jgi:hypothetical protein
VVSVSSSALTVKNFAGTSVTVPGTATVTTIGLTPLAVGARVTVYGAQGSDGAVTATSVVVRSAA